MQIKRLHTIRRQPSYITELVPSDNSLINEEMKTTVKHSATANNLLKQESNFGFNLKNKLDVVVEEAPDTTKTTLQTL